MLTFLAWQIIIRQITLISFKNQQKVAQGSSLSTPYCDDEILLINQTPIVK